MKGIVTYYKESNIVYDTEIENCKILIEELRDSILNNNKVDSVLLYTHLYVKLNTIRLVEIANCHKDLKNLVENLDYLADFYCNLYDTYDLYFYITDYDLSNLLVERGDTYLRKYIKDILIGRGEIDE